MGFELFFGFLGVPEHVRKASFFLGWLRALSGGLGTQFDASGDSKKVPGGSSWVSLGCFLGDSFFIRFFVVFYFVFKIVDPEFVSLSIVF